MTGNRYFVVQVGYTPGVYFGYHQARRQAVRYPRCYMKGFRTLVKAEEYFGLGLPSYYMEDELQMTTAMEARNSLKVYTYGVCRGNGQENAHGAFGLYFGCNDTRNHQEVLSGPRHTNQRADLIAVLRAIQLVADEDIPVGSKKRPLLIYTKSEYVVFCLTIGYQKWIRNGWKTVNGDQVKNQDLIVDIMTEMRQNGLLVAVEHVRTNANNEGMSRACDLATGAADRAWDNRDIDELAFHCNHVTIA